MKKQIIYMVCATALLSSCHIYKAYERPDSIDATGIYRDPVSETDTLASADTAWPITSAAVTSAACFDGRMV